MCIFFFWPGREKLSNTLADRLSASCCGSTPPGPAHLQLLWGRLHLQHCMQHAACGNGMMASVREGNRGASSSFFGQQLLLPWEFVVACCWFSSCCGCCWLRSLSNKRQMVCAIFLLGMNVQNYLRWHFFACVGHVVAHVDTATILSDRQTDRQMVTESANEVVKSMFRYCWAKLFNKPFPRLVKTLFTGRIK